MNRSKIEIIAVLVATVLLAGSTSAFAQDRSQVYAADFQAFWDDVNSNCSLLGVKGIDWDAIGSEYMARICECTSDAELIDVMREVVGKLKDGHAYVNPNVTVPDRPAEQFPGVSFAKAADGSIVVLEVQQGASGDARHLRAGMTVTEIDGTDAGEFIATKTAEIWDRGYVSSERRAEFIALRLGLRGEAGSEVTVTAGFGDDQRRCELRRDCAAAYSRTYAAIPNLERAGDVSWGLFEGGIGYVYLRRMTTSRNRFGECFARAMDALRGARALIIDLRGNSGGGIGEDFTSRFQGESAFQGPVAVLIDPGTFSAGEGAASFFRERTTARLMGVTTAGSSSKKRTFEAPSGKFSVYYSWRGQYNFGRQMTEFYGIEPHEELAIIPSELAQGKDSFVMRAAEYLHSELTGEPRPVPGEITDDDDGQPREEAETSAPPADEAEAFRRVIERLCDLAGFDDWHEARGVREADELGEVLDTRDRMRFIGAARRALRDCEEWEQPILEAIRDSLH